MNSDFTSQVPELQNHVHVFIRLEKNMAQVPAVIILRGHLHDMAGTFCEMDFKNPGVLFGLFQYPFSLILLAVCM